VHTYALDWMPPPAIVLANPGLPSYRKRAEYGSARTAAVQAAVPEIPPLSANGRYTRDGGRLTDLNNVYRYDRYESCKLL
jgi:hypothetical protein